MEIQGPRSTRARHVISVLGLVVPGDTWPSTITSLFITLIANHCQGYRVFLYKNLKVQLACSIEILKNTAWQRLNPTDLVQQRSSQGVGGGNLFSLRVTEYWNKLSREFAEPPSLEILKTLLDIFLCNPLPGNFFSVGFNYMISRDCFQLLSFCTILCKGQQRTHNQVIQISILATYCIQSGEEENKTSIFLLFPFPSNLFYLFFLSWNSKTIINYSWRVRSFIFAQN